MDNRLRKEEVMQTRLLRPRMSCCLRSDTYSLYNATHRSRPWPTPPCEVSALRCALSPKLRHGYVQKSNCTCCWQSLLRSFSAGRGATPSQELHSSIPSVP